MIVLQIKNNKDFMARFLASETFDNFLLESAELKLGCTYNIDGHVNKDFFSEEESSFPTESLTSWSEMRPVCFNLIKGRHTPLSFKFILTASTDKKDELLSSDDMSEVKSLVSSFVFILKFENGHITLTTGAALSGFSLDKSYEKVWDSYIRSFLSAAGISFDESI